MRSKWFAKLQDPRSKPRRSRAKQRQKRRGTYPLAMERLEMRLALSVSAVSVVDAGLQGDSGNDSSADYAFTLPGRSRSWVTRDGRLSVFTSEANNLVDNDFNGARDVFVRDLASGVSSLVSDNYLGAASGNDYSVSAVVSADGRFVAFESYATDLVPGFVNGGNSFNVHVFIRDLEARVTQLVSVNNAGIAGANGSSSVRGISDDGRFVLFQSFASDLAAPGVDTNGNNDFYVRDVVAGNTSLVSIVQTGTAAGGMTDSTPAAISGNGRYVTFVSSSNSLVAGDANNAKDVFVRDLQTSSTTIVSVNQDGTGSGNSTSGQGQGSEGLGISPDGRFIAFSSSATDLVPGFGNLNGSSPDYYLRDMLDGVTTLVSVNTDGSGGGNGAGSTLALTPDGRHVAFDSTSSNLVDGVGYVASSRNVFVRDVQAGTTALVTINAAGTSGASDPTDAAFNQTPAISDDGRYVSFKSSDDSLVANDGNHASDVFLRDLQTGTTMLVSGNRFGTDSGNQASGGDSSFTPALSGDGRKLIYLSSASDLVANDNNGWDDVFVFDVATAANALVSARAPAMPAAYTANGLSQASDITPDARYVLFTSFAGNLASDSNSDLLDVFVRDRQVGTNILVSRNADGTGSGNDSSGTLPPDELESPPSGRITPDGRYVLFVSKATDLVNGFMYPADLYQLYRRDLVANTTTLVSVNAAGTAGVNLDIVAEELAISPDGRYVMFSTPASDVVAGASESGTKTYLRDLQSGTTTLISRDPSTIAGFGSDSRSLCFESSDNGLVAGDDNSAPDVFAYDLPSGALELISVNQAGAVIGGASPSMSADGRHIAFTAGGIVYVRNRIAHSTTLASVNLSGSGAPADNPVISANGRFVAFTSSATDLVSTPTNGSTQLYVRDLQAGVTTLISVNAAGAAGGNSQNDAYRQAISADGRYVAFTSHSTDLVEGFADNNGAGQPDIFLRDLAAGATTLVTASISQPGGANGGLADTLLLSSDGQVLVFGNSASDLIVGDRNRWRDVFEFVYEPATVPRPDLVVQDVSVSAAAAVGRPVVVTWTIANTGTADALVDWQDAIYLSHDATLDAGDVLLGMVSHSGGLPVNQSYAGGATLSLPGVAEGDYHVLVRADRRRQVTAETALADNVAASPGTLSAVIPELTNGVPLLDAFSGPNQDRYYQVSVQAGESLLLALDSAGLEGGTELYIRRADLPSPYAFDYAARKPSRPDQALLVPFTQAGTYFILAHSRYGGAAVSSFTISATIGANLHLLAIDSLDVSRGGNAGRVTIGIQGKFPTPDTQVQLVAGSTILAAAAIDVRETSRIFATFDLTGAPAGAYDVRLVDGPQTATLPGGFTIVDEPAAQENPLQVFLQTPSQVRRGSVDFVTVEYVNAGNTDIVAPLVELVADASVFQPREGADYTAPSIQFLAIGSDGPAGLLRPGHGGRFVARFKMPLSAIHAVSFTLSSVVSDATIDWAAQKDSLRPEFIPPEAWDVTFNNFVATTGATGGEYNQMLANNATYLSRLGIFTSDISRLLSFELQQAGAALAGSIAAAATDASLQATGIPLTFGRIALQSIAGRYRLGPLGRGWTHNWEITATTDTAGNVAIEQAGRFRFFTRQADGSFRGSAGDYAALSVSAGVYRLRERDGTVLDFRDDGKLDLVEDRNGNRITAGYDAGGRLSTLTHSSGPILTLSYNAQGKLAQVADLAGRTVTYAYDAAGEHLLSVTEQLTGAAESARTTAYSYLTGQGAAREHALESIAFADGTHVFYDYDGQGRLIGTQRDGGAEAVSLTYDGDAGVTFTDAAGSATLWFNDFGRPELVRDALDRTSQLDYDANFNLVQLVTPGGNASTLGYDARGNLARSINALGQAVDFTYESQFNLLASYRDARGNTTRYDRNSQGNLRAIIYPNGSQEQFSYDPLGNLAESINRRGGAIDYTYDGRGRLVRKDFADGTHADFTYDGRDNLLTATGSAGTIALDYDTADRLTKITYSSGRFLEFSYDTRGRRTRSVDQDGFRVNYAYDVAGRLSELTGGASNLIVRYTYDAAGRLVRKDLGNGTFATYEYDAAGQLLSLVNHAPDNSVNSVFDYTYDADGRRTNMTTADGTTTYGYDATGQLTSVVLPGGRTIEYVYEPAGNRVSVTDDGMTTFYSANELNQYTTIGTASYQYDADGNLASRIDGVDTTTYSWDAENHLVGLTGPVGTFSYEYDPFGNRVAATRDGARTEYLVDPIGLGNVVGEYAGNGSLIANYTHGLGLVSRTDVNGAAYYDFDAIGSTVGLTDAAGVYVNRYSYLPFGETTTLAAALLNLFTYAGQWGVSSDASSLFHMRAREYGSDAGQFLSNDPIGLAGGDMNLRRYVGNAPVDFIDPSGLEPMAFMPFPTTKFELNGGEDQEEQDRYDKGLDDAKRRYYDTHPDLITESVRDQLKSITERERARGEREQALREAEVVTKRQQEWMQSAEYLQTLLPAVDTSKELKKLRELFPVGAFDPNDIAGPGGFGAAQFTRPEPALLYTIRFENDPNQATAPAQDVIITDTLDPGLDWTTFELGDFGFGSLIVDVHRGLQAYRKRLEYTNQDGSALFVDVEAGLDLEHGVVTWSFRSVDPETGELPAGVFDGFLPVNDDTGRGQGFATYFVRPRAALGTGTTVDASAGIVFDINDPVLTNVYTNTIDAGGPASSVAALDAVTNAPVFTVRWSGQDDEGGSGVASYDVFVSIDGGEYSRWRHDVTIEQDDYTGQPGHSYAFYSVATDNVGHNEAPPLQYDAWTYVNLPPTAQDHDADVDEDGSLVIDILGLAGDGDGTVDPAGVTVVGSPAHGGWSIDSATGKITYAPAHDYFGDDSFSYTVKDNHGAVSNVYWVRLTVDPVNDAPSFTKGADQVVVQGSGPRSVPGWATAIKAGPANEAGQALQFIVTNSNNTLFSAQPQLSADGTLTFTPAAGKSGTSIVTVRLRDDGGTGHGGHDTSAAQTFTITVNPLLRYDFNAKKSPTAAGFTGVKAGDLYTAARGYGWVKKVQDFDNKTGDALLRDGHAGKDATFRVLLAPGASYTATLTFRDKKAHDRIDVYAEGGLAIDNLNIPANTTVTRPLSGVVGADGILDLRFDDDGGKDKKFVINAIEIVQHLEAGAKPVKAAAQRAPGRTQTVPTTAATSERTSSAGRTPAAKPSLRSIAPVSSLDAYFAWLGQQSTLNARKRSRAAVHQ